jgi:hypothetical protein
MAEQKSFFERVKENAISYAPLYKRYFVDYEYLLCSEAFSQADGVSKFPSRPLPSIQKFLSNRRSKQAPGR